MIDEMNKNFTSTTRKELIDTIHRYEQKVDELKSEIERLSKPNSLSVNSDIAHHLTRINQDRIEAQIRLYGILWLLVEETVISEGKARELAKYPLHKMIDECLQYRQSLEDE
jgi:hypothetical protein